MFDEPIFRICRVPHFGKADEDKFDARPDAHGGIYGNAEFMTDLVCRLKPNPLNFCSKAVRVIPDYFEGLFSVPFPDLSCQSGTDIFCTEENEDVAHLFLLAPMGFDRFDLFGADPFHFAKWKGSAPKRSNR